MSATLLIELGTEELPPKALQTLTQSFADGIEAGLRAADLPLGRIEVLGSPRRLAVRIAEVASKAPDSTEQRLGPAVAAAFDDDGKPTKAAEGFARSCGVAVADLEQRDTDKGKRLAYHGIAVGQTVATLLPAVFATAIKHLPIPKRMRWGQSEHAFVRPVHWLTVLHGDRVVPLNAFGCSAGRATRGHRFHHPDPIILEHADDYVARLENPGHVIVDMGKRRQLVMDGVKTAACNIGGKAIFNPALAEEVSALVEWPVALAGAFDERYLALPQEVLIATLQGHQRYFPVADANGTLMASFVTVANIESHEPARIVAGNERVIRPRLADALFFWERDKARGLESLATELQRVTFQRELGSLAEKTARVASIAAHIAGSATTEPSTVARACALSKADLLTEMVDEFPELQGTMGRYYARAAGEAEAVAIALDEQYAPRQARAAIAQHPVGRVLAVADRLDTLAGIFAIGGRPSGEKDPYALRRAALGILRTSIEGHYELNLRTALTFACELQPVKKKPDGLLDDLLCFHRDRLRGYYHDRNIGTDSFEAVAANGLTHPVDFDRRIQAVQAFLSLPTAIQLCSAHKRIRNILKKGAPEGEVDTNLLTEPAEQRLHQELSTLMVELEKRTKAGDYAGALNCLATLQKPVDRFFNEVLVMSEDVNLKRNRLALLGALDEACRSVADISRLEPDVGTST